MSLLYSPESRAERLIAGGRIALAASSLLAVWLDPTEPRKYATVAYSLLVAYVVYSGVVALVVWRAPAPPNRQRILTHVFDLAFFSLFTYFTSGPAESPFIAYFVFSMVCATLRWQWRGTLWTAIAALTTFMGLGVYFAEGFGDGGIDLTPFVIRAVYLVVFAFLLGYLGVHEERTRREMAVLASWPQPTTEQPRELLRELLVTASRALEVRHAIAVTADREEPWWSVATLAGERFTETREGPETLGALIAPELEGAGFLCHLPADPEPVVLCRQDGALRTLRVRPLAAPFLERAGRDTVLSLPLHGETVDGRLFFLGKRALTSDDLVLGEIATAMLAARLDQAALVRQLRAAAAADARVRLARDLHDGVLQSFTAIGLRLGAARRIADEHPAEVAAHLQDVQRLLADEQRDLRFFIQELQRQDLTGEAPLGERLRALCERIERTWGVRVQVSAALGAEPTVAMGREIYSLVREAIVNAARHGAARRVTVGLEERGDRIVVSIEDDGRGFPFAGSFDGASLRARGLGPRSLRERTSALGGAFALRSTATGARVQMDLPAGGDA